MLLCDFLVFVGIYTSSWSTLLDPLADSLGHRRAQEVTSMATAMIALRGSSSTLSFVFRIELARTSVFATLEHVCL